MDAVSLKLARNYTNEKLNSLPSNRPTKTVSFDGGIYSVGNDVVNGQISACVLKGRTVFWNQLLKATYPDWSLVGISIVNNGDGSWTISGTPTSIATFRLSRVGSSNENFQGISGEKWLFTVGGNLSALTGIRLVAVINGVNINPITSGGTIITLSENSNVNIAINNNSDSIGVEIPATIFKPMLINLTKMFGAGNEPATVEEFTKLFPSVYYPYDAGSTKSTNSVRLRSVNEDETKESIAYVNLPQGEELRSLPNGVKDEVNVTSGIKTQRVGNKTNVASGTVINYTDMATAGQFEAWGSGEHVVGVKGDTLAFTATSLNYQLATPIVTKLPAQAPLQVFENGTVYVEPIGDPSETTLPTVELTAPIAGGNKVGIATHDYAGAAADWTLTNNESKCKSLLVTNAGGAANIIAPDKPGLTFTINNKSAQAITIKISGGTGVAITNGKKVTVQHFGTDYEAISSEI